MLSFHGDRPCIQCVNQMLISDVESHLVVSPRLCAMSTVSMPLAPTLVTQICSLSV